jgi:hypothetical protein
MSLSFFMERKFGRKKLLIKKFKPKEVSGLGGLTMTFNKSNVVIRTSENC